MLKSNARAMCHANVGVRQRKHLSLESTLIEHKTTTCAGSRDACTQHECCVPALHDASLGPSFTSGSSDRMPQVRWEISSSASNRPRVWRIVPDRLLGSVRNPNLRQQKDRGGNMWNIARLFRRPQVHTWVQYSRDHHAPRQLADLWIRRYTNVDYRSYRRHHLPNQDR